jgi:hypothetical protein
MHRERQRHPRRERLLRRPVDRIEDLVLWILIALGLLTVVLAATVGARRYGEGMHRVDTETGARTQVQAVLLEPAQQLLVADDPTRAVRQIPIPVPVRYTAPDGTAHQANALVVGRHSAGATESVWVDRSGAITDAPARSVDAVTSAVVGGVGVLVIGLLALAFTWATVHARILRLNAARWGRDWEQVEPQWSGRAV